MKQTISIIFLIVSHFAMAQNNYFAEGNYLSDLTAADDGSYLGIDEDDNLIKLDSEFNHIWGLGNFAGTLVDFSVNPSTYEIFALSILDSALHITSISTDGETTHYLHPAEGAIHAARIEAEPNGFVIALLGEFTEDSDLKSVVLSRFNESAETIWTEALYAIPGFEFNNLDLVVNAEKETILLLNGLIGDSEMKGNTLSKYSFAGAHTWTKLFGNDCTNYYDLAELNNGQIIIVGQHKEDEFEGLLKVSVCASNGDLLATKEQNYSHVDQGYNQARVAVLSDNRYVVSNRHYEGGIGSQKGKFIFFDNHKPVGALYFKPFEYPNQHHVHAVDIWGVDEEDRILFTSKTCDVWVTGSDYLLGRFQWGEVGCDLGELHLEHEMRYRKECSTDTTLESFTYEILFSPEEITLDSIDFTTNLYCSADLPNPWDPVLEEHLWDEESWYFCPLTGCPEEPIDDSGITDNLIQGGFVSVYPNPSTGIMRLDGIANGKVDVFSVDGRLLASIPVLNENPTLDLSTYGGTLLLHVISTEENWTEVLKVVVQ